MYKKKVKRRIIIKVGISSLLNTSVCLLGSTSVADALLYSLFLSFLSAVLLLVFLTPGPVLGVHTFGQLALPKSHPWADVFTCT
jgi:hypothetical protein